MMKQSKEPLASKEAVPVVVPAYRMSLDVERDITAVRKVLESGWITQGKEVEKLEESWSSICGTKYAVAVSSGQNALEVVLLNWVEKNMRCPKIAVQANAFVGDALAALRIGDLVVVDCDEQMQISYEALARLNSTDIAIVLMVHIGGYASSMTPQIRMLCKSRGWYLIEDCCHAHGTRIYDNVHVGSFGDAGVFSFYATKPVTCGEGGMIVTDDEKLYESARMFRNNGSDTLFNREYVGALAGDCRMSDILAAIANVETDSLWRHLDERNEIAHHYNKVIAENTDVLIPLYDLLVKQNYYKYVAFINPDSGLNRSQITEHFRKRGIVLPSPVYDMTVDSHPIIKPCIAKNTGSKTASRICSDHVCLPMYSNMTLEEVSAVSSAIVELSCNEL